jgi:putative ABC transport system permease protein
VFIASLAFRNIVRQRRRSLTAVLAVAGGVASLMLASGFIDWNLRYGRESTIHSQLGHVRVFKPGFVDAGSSDPFKFLIPDDSGQLGRIRSFPHVVAVAPRISFNGLISHGDATLSFIGEGVDPDQERELSRSITIVEGRGMSTADPRSVLLGQGLAANLGIKPGDIVVLMVTTASGGVNAAELEVVGLFATITKAYDDSALRAPIRIVRELLRVSGAHSYAVLLDDTDRTPVVTDGLRSEFKGKPLEFVPWYRLADFYNKTAELFSRQVSVLRLIIAAIIVLTISNSMMMSVLERTGEIGTAMALGTRRRHVLQLFLTEGVFLGILGGSIGLATGLVLASLATAIGIPMPAPPGTASGYTAGILVSWPLAAEALALAIATTLIASVYPSWRASRMSVVDALRRNR